MTYALNEKENDERWRKRIKFRKGTTKTQIMEELERI